jgi:hypothetical protein
MCDSQRYGQSIHSPSLSFCFAIRMNVIGFCDHLKSTGFCPVFFYREFAEEIRRPKSALPASALCRSDDTLLDIAEPPTPCWSRPRRRDWHFPAQDLGGRRQFHLLGWQALGQISAKEHADIFLYEPGGVIGSQDHACVEAQRRIGKWLYDYTVSIYKDAGRGVVLGIVVGRDRRNWTSSGPQPAHRIAQKARKTAVFE